MAMTSPSRRSDPVTTDPAEAMARALRPLLRHAPLLARSRKIGARGVSDGRALLTMPRAALLAPEDPAPLSAVIGTTLPEALMRHWTRAEVVHLGLDPADAGAGMVRKLYLEFGEDPPEPGLAYLAVKAGAADQGLHRYDRLTDPSPVLRQLDLPAALAAALHPLLTTGGEVLRVAEVGTARLSLDINLADLDPHPALEATLAALVAHVNRAAAPPRLWPSHVAVGRDRAGEVFITLYGWPGEVAP